MLLVWPSSVIVEELFSKLNTKATKAERLTALLHDAAEYVIGDMISPFKNALGLDYRTFENRLEEAIHIRFGLPAQIPAKLKKSIKLCDIYCAWLEATQIAGFSIEESNDFFQTPPLEVRVEITPKSVVAAEKLFIERFEKLTD